MMFSQSFLSIAVILTIATGIDISYGQVCQLTSPLQQSLDGLGVTVPCDAVLEPIDCDFTQIPLLKVEDYERCGPLMLNHTSRNFFIGAAGRRITYNENKAAYRRIRIVPKMLRDVSQWSLGISTLGQSLSFPVGLSPTASHKLAHPEGETATARGMKNSGVVMILSSYSSTVLEEVAYHARGGSSHLWMQTYIFTNRTLVKDLVSRAEKAGFEAIVVTIDSPVGATFTCNSQNAIQNVPLPNIPGNKSDSYLFDKSLTFKDLRWVKSLTKLPIIAKGILSGQDAVNALRAGASAILVSNQGGRQLDGDPATIDVLPGIVDAVRKIRSRADVYVDGGIRNGWDMYKAIASGAKMVFIGRPQLYGLAMEGEDGVRNVLEILRTEFEEAMLLSDASGPSKISRDTLIRPTGCKTNNDGYFSADSILDPLQQGIQ